MMTSEITTGQAFIPSIGKLYEIHFGMLKYKGQEGFVSCNIRCEGMHPSEWIDLNTNQTLDPELQ